MTVETVSWLDPRRFARRVGTLGKMAASLGPTAARQVIVGVSDEQRSRLPSAISALSGGAVVLTTRR